MKYALVTCIGLLLMSCNKDADIGKGVCYLSSAPYQYAQGGARFLLPNAFTPNSDGRNDVFRPIGISGLTNFSMTVYDASGNTIFRTIDLYTSGWDGRTNSGIQLANGKYAVNFRFTTINGDIVNQDFCISLLTYGPGNCLTRTLEGAYFFEDQLDVTTPGHYYPTLESICP